MTSTPAKKTTCNNCGQQFPSRNAYFKHQRENNCVCSLHSNSDPDPDPDTDTDSSVPETKTLSPRTPPSETTIINENLGKLNNNSTLPEIISAYNNLISNLTNLYVSKDGWCPYGCSNGISNDDIEEILYQSEKNLLSKFNLEAISD